jgi:hypothetical protein
MVAIGILAAARRAYLTRMPIQTPTAAPGSMLMTDSAKIVDPRPSRGPFARLKSVLRRACLALASALRPRRRPAEAPAAASRAATPPVAAAWPTATSRREPD